MAKEDNAKAGVDFEWVNSNAKDSKGNPVKTRRFFTRAEKAAIKEGKKPEVKSEKAPAKSAPKVNKGMDTSPRPKARPKADAKTDSVRPEGKAAGMPAAKKSGVGKKAVVAGVGAVAAAVTARAAMGGKKPVARPVAQGRAYNPSYTGKAGAPEGFRGKFETGLARAAGKGAGMRRIGPGGAGMKSAIDKAKDPLMLMSKGGMVKKGRK